MSTKPQRPKNIPDAEFRKLISINDSMPVGILPSGSSRRPTMTELEIKTVNGKPEARLPIFRQSQPGILSF